LFIQVYIMKELFVLISIVTLLVACNNRPAEETTVKEEPAPQTEVKKEVNVTVEQPPPPDRGVNEVKVDPSGVEIKARTKGGTEIDIDTKEPK
jgi:hypothetical protein